VSLQEVRHAVKLLHAQSAAIGVPTALVKLLASHDVMLVLVGVIQRMFDEGVVPADHCVVRAVVLHKKGDRADKANYRIIGVGPAISRVVQLVVLQRLLVYASSPLAISANQHGFVFGRSTEQCVFSVLSAAACATERGNMATGVFLDIASAFASTPHSLIMCRLRQLGAPRYLWRFVDVWLLQQRMFVQIGRQASPLFPVNVGVVEGGPGSPLQFVLVLNALPRRLDVFAGVSGYGIGFGDTALVHKWFADDGTLWGRSAAAVQPLLDACGEEASELGMVFNVGPAKTAAVCLLPTGKSQRARVKRELQRQPQHLHLREQHVPMTQTYKYLGVWVHSGGYRASVRHHVQQLQPVCGAVLRQALSAGLRQLSLFHGVCVYNTFWKPRLTYCLGFYAATVDQRLQHVEEVVLKLMCGAPNMPLCVLRAIVGVPSFHCVLQQQQLGLLWRVLSAPPGDMQRMVLAEMVRLCGQKDARTLWWHRLTPTLHDMDRMCAAGDAVDAAGVMGGGTSWYASVAALATRPHDDVTRGVLAMRKHYKHVLLVAEQQRRAAEVQRCVASLGEVQELLLSPNYAPFIVEPRSAACELRIQLRGGVRALFDAKFRHVDVCPWCGVHGGFTVPHLLRDCVALEAERVQCWQEALTLGVQQGVMDQHDVATHRQQWYLLMVGAAVPHHFCRLHLDTDTHWARDDSVSATGHLRKRYDVYMCLLRCVGVFLVSTVSRTAERLVQEHANLHRRAATNARRTVALRWSSQQLQRLRQKQQQQ